MKIISEISEIIDSIDYEKAHINPTEIYNEGWMLRLLVKKSVENNININSLMFKDFSFWTSEALISSPFIKAPILREGYTHADMALGDFIVDYNNRGEIKVNADAKCFGIIEAKMKSNLSQGTKYAKEYNQATRNIACIAKNTNDSCKRFFAVACPRNYIEIHKIDIQIKLENILKQLKKRFDRYDNEFKKEQNEDKIIERVMKTEIFVISYEDWIENFEGNIKESLNVFYEKAKKWNRI